MARYLGPIHARSERGATGKWTADTPRLRNPASSQHPWWVCISYTAWTSQFISPKQKTELSCAYISLFGNYSNRINFLSLRVAGINCFYDYSGFEIKIF